MKTRIEGFGLHILALLLLISLLFTGCATSDTKASVTDSGEEEKVEETVQEKVDTTIEGKPKYIFLFIGDGMSYAQATSLGYYNGTVNNNFEGTLDNPTIDNQPEAEMPSFTDFETVGSVTTYDSSKFITDSASAATAISSGVKTLDGMIGIDPYGKECAPISETLAKEAGYNIGILSTVSLDHATPAGFYAHVESRDNYYDIATQLVDSDYVDFAGGGGFKKPNGKDGDQENIIDLAKATDWNVVNTKEEIEALDSSSGKTIAINPDLDNNAALNYQIDKGEDAFGLGAYVEKAIDVMGTDEPFFIMAEGGKIDWSCHANDAYTCINEVKDLEAAVNVAIKFYNEHPDETLILVTGDHETGGFTLGYGGTGYDTYFSVLGDQSISFNKFKLDYIDVYRENGTTFEEAMKDVKELFGLIMPGDEDAETADPRMVLTDAEVEVLRTAYEVSMIPIEERETDTIEYQTEYTYYPKDYEAFTVKITHILNQRAGIAWTSTAHTGLPVAMYAQGVGAETFGNFYDNTEINPKIQELVGLK